MFRFLSPLFVFLLAAMLWFQQCGSSSDQVQNVLLISLDTCRADHLSCYGFPRNTTPNIDRLAREGILFSRVMTPVPLTLPAHSSMLTGTIPLFHGVHANGSYKLDETNLTLAEILKQNDFTTAAIISAFVLDSRFGVDQGFDYYNDHFENKLSKTDYNERRGDEVNRLALEWLDQNNSERFFMFLHYYDPHEEYDPPEPFASDYSEDLYAGEIAYTDFCIGQVIDKLKELGLYGSTLIIVTSDHGEMLGEHGEDGHGYFIYRGAIDVPLIFKLPGRLEGSKVDDLVGLIDIVPTVCQVLGFEVPDQIQGESLTRYFDKKTPSGRNRLLYCESLYPSRIGANNLLGVVDDRWKFIKTTRSELYDLMEDPDETNNLIEQMPQQAAIMEESLNQLVTESKKTKVSGTTMVLDEESRRGLEALGYITAPVTDMDLEFDPGRADPKDLIDLNELTEKGQMLLFYSKFDEAKSVFEEIRQKWPQLYSAYLYLGMIAKERGDLNGAVPYLNEAIRLKPTEPESHYQLGEILMQLGGHAQAVEHFEEALRIRPDQIEALNNLGIVLMMMGRPDKAVVYFEKVVEIDPDEVKALTNLGLLLSQQGNTEEALPYLYRATELDPENLRAQTILGNQLKLRGEFDFAIDHFTKVLEINPDQIQVLNTLAWIKAVYASAHFHDPEDAVRLALRACELTDYKNPLIVNTLSTAHAAAGNFPDAVKMAERALDLFVVSGPPELIPFAEECLEMFISGKAYSEPLPAPAVPTEE